MKQKTSLQRHHYTLTLAFCSLLPVVIALVSTRHAEAVQRQSILDARRHIQDLERFDRLILALRAGDDKAFHKETDAIRAAASEAASDLEVLSFVLEQLRIIESAHAVLQHARAIAPQSNEVQRADMAASKAIIEPRRYSRSHQMAAMQASICAPQRTRQPEPVMV